MTISEQHIDPFKWCDKSCTMQDWLWQGFSFQTGRPGSPWHTVAGSAVLVKERHHGIRVAVVQRGRGAAAGGRARHRRQPAEHHRLLLLLLLADVAVLLLLWRQTIASDRGLPVEAVEALIESAVINQVIVHSRSLLEQVRRRCQVRNVHAELDQQRKVIWKDFAFLFDFCFKLNWSTS